MSDQREITPLIYACVSEACKIKDESVGFADGMVDLFLRYDAALREENQRLKEQLYEMMIHAPAPVYIGTLPKEETDAKRD